MGVTGAAPPQLDEHRLDRRLGGPTGDGLTGEVWEARALEPGGRARRVAVRLVARERATLATWALRPAHAARPPAHAEGRAQAGPRAGSPAGDLAEAGVVRWDDHGPLGGPWLAWLATDLVRALPLDEAVGAAGFAARARALALLARALAALHAEAPARAHGALRPGAVLWRHLPAPPDLGDPELVGADADLAAWLPLRPLLDELGVRPRWDPARTDGPAAAPRLYPYLAPEAVDAFRAGDLDAVGPAGDVFALGALACALMTGLAPGAEVPGDAAAILARRARTRPLVAAAPAPDDPFDPRGFGAVVRACLDPAPGGRPTAVEAARALDACGGLAAGAPGGENPPPLALRPAGAPPARPR